LIDGSQRSGNWEVDITGATTASPIPESDTILLTALGALLISARVCPLLWPRAKQLKRWMHMFGLFQ